MPHAPGARCPVAQEKIEKTALTKEQIVFWISKFKGGDIDDPAYRQNLVDIFVNSIFLYDDKLVIGFNWKDGSKTVSLAELETAMREEGSDKSQNTAEFLGSFLDDNRPPKLLQYVIFVVIFFVPSVLSYWRKCQKFQFMTNDMTH